MSNSLAQSLARKLNTTTTLSTESVDVDVNIGQDAILDEDGASVSPLAPATDEPIIEAQQTELVEEESELDATEDEAVDTDNDIETLEAIQLHIEKSLENGGLDTVSYEMLNVTMDHIYRKYGISASDVLPSMESFAEDNLSQTTVSMEKVSDTLKTVKEGAVQIIKKLWFQLKNFLVNLIKMNTDVKKRAASVSKQAGNANAAVKGGELKLYSAKHLMIGGKVPEKGVLVKAFNDLTNGVDKLDNVIGAYMNTHQEMITEVLKAGNKTDGETYKKVIDASGRSGQAFAQLTPLFKFKDAKFGVASIDGKDGQKMTMNTMKFETAKAPERGTDSDGYKVDSLQVSEIKTVCSNIIACVDRLDKVTKTFNQSSMEKAVVSLSDAKEDAEGYSRKEINMARKAVRTMISNQGKIVSYINTTNKAMLDYCVQSLQAINKASKGVDTKADDKSKSSPSTEVATV